jgi:hypothetical protein
MITAREALARGNAGSRGVKVAITSAGIRFHEYFFNDATGPPGAMQSLRR